MTVGAALARGLQIGQRNTSQFDLGSVMSSLHGYRGSGTPGYRSPTGARKTGRRSPAVIRSNAADQMLAEKSMVLMERKQDLEERKQAMEEERERQAKLERYYTRTEGIQTRVGERADVASEKAHTARLGAIGAGVTVAKQRRSDIGRAAKERFNEARWGIENKQARPVLDYFDNFGAANVRIEGIQFQPDGDEIMVTYPGNKKVVFKNADEAFKNLLLPTHPDMPAYLKKAKAEREETRKETEVGLKVSKEVRETRKGKALTANELAELREKYNKQYSDLMKNQGVDEADRGTWVNARMAEHEVKKKEAPTPKERPEIVTKGKPKIVRNKKTGELWYQYPDGTRQKWTPAKGERSEVIQQSITKPEEKKPAEKPWHEKTTAIPPREKGSATYVDAKGNTVKQTIDAKGNIVKTIVKKKKKKKRKFY